MLKISFLALALFGGSFVAMNTGRTVYSGFSGGIPVGGAIKMTPDPGSVWSFHEEVTVASGQTVNVPVLVDFDGNGVMDTEHPNLRVMITDLQASDRGTIDTANDRSYARVHLRSGGEVRWDLTPFPRAGTTSQRTAGLMSNSASLTTPIVLEPSTVLNVEVFAPANGPARTIRINLIGRVVNL